MSHTDTIDDERRRSLDEFASTPTPTRNNIMVPPGGYAGVPAERVFGAVNVAVQRDEKRVLMKLKSLAAAAGEDWYYRFPVRNNQTGSTDWIEGPSIKLANDVARTYGNCDVDCRSVDLGDSWLFYARFTDFETGYTLTRPFQQRKGQSTFGEGRGDNKKKQAARERQQDIAFQIGASKAIRNVVVNALQTFSDFAYNEARNSLIDKIKAQGIDKWRERTINGIGNIPVELVRVEAVIGRTATDWLAPDIARIIAMMKSIADGMATVDETFPALDKQVNEPDAKEQGTGATASQGEPAQVDEAKSTQTGESEAGDEADGEGEDERDHEADEARQEAAAQQQAVGDKQANKKNAKQGEAATGKTPTTEREWKVYAETWIENVTVATNAEQRWAAEKTLRNKCNVSGEVREEVKAKLDKRVAALKAEG
jgi:hypothetical protein